MQEQMSDSELEDENNPEVISRKNLFKYLMNKDFSKQVDLAEMLEVNFELSVEEDSLTPSIPNLLKLIKMLLFQIGMINERVKTSQDLFYDYSCSKRSIKLLK